MSRSYAESMDVVIAFLEPRLNSHFMIEHVQGAGGTDIGWWARVRYLEPGPTGQRVYPNSIEARSCEAEGAMSLLAEKIEALIEEEADDAALAQG